MLISQYLATLLSQTSARVKEVYDQSPRNVQVVLRRQILSALNNDKDRPVSGLIGMSDFFHVLQSLELPDALFTLARVYDEIHIYLCKTTTSAGNGKVEFDPPSNRPCVDLILLTNQLREDHSRIQDRIVLNIKSHDPLVLQAEWKPNTPMSFDKLPVLPNLSGLLPGEKKHAERYAGVGGGGGSDVISASLLGHLLRRYGKTMDLLISTRTWTTGSQGKEGSKMGIKREVHQHGGQAYWNNKSVPGTYLITPATHSEGRDLETIPLSRHKMMYMVLDQGAEHGNIPESDRAPLPEQFQAVLSQCPVETVMVVDTGGDVFGADSAVFGTVDQDLRVQQAMSTLDHTYDVVTVVFTPGVDAPADAPEKALQAGGMIYKPTADERAMLLDLLVKEYRMDGSDPARFGKTSLALQARLRGRLGWTSLDLPEHVVDTWKNPWSSFVYIRECMSDIILMPLTKLLPFIEPRSR